MRVDGKRKVRDDPVSHLLSSLTSRDFQAKSHKRSVARTYVSTSLILPVKVYGKCAAAGLLVPGLPKKWKDLGGITPVAGIGDESTILQSTLPVFAILRPSPRRVGYFSSNHCTSSLVFHIVNNPPIRTDYR